MISQFLSIYLPWCREFYHISFRCTCMLFYIAYEGNFRSLCTVTFWQKVDFLISNTCRLYDIQSSYFPYAQNWILWFDGKPIMLWFQCLKNYFGIKWCTLFPKGLLLCTITGQLLGDNWMAIGHFQFTPFCSETFSKYLEKKVTQPPYSI